MAQKKKTKKPTMDEVRAALESMPIPQGVEIPGRPAPEPEIKPPSRANILKLFAGLCRHEAISRMRGNWQMGDRLYHKRQEWFVLGASETNGKKVLQVTKVGKVHLKEIEDTPDGEEAVVWLPHVYEFFAPERGLWGMIPGNSIAGLQVKSLDEIVLRGGGSGLFGRKRPLTPWDVPEGEGMVNIAPGWLHESWGRIHEYHAPLPIALAETVIWYWEGQQREIKRKKEENE